MSSISGGQKKWHWGLFSLQRTSSEDVWYRKQRLCHDGLQGKGWYSWLHYYQMMSHRVLTIKDDQIAEMNSITGVSIRASRLSGAQWDTRETVFVLVVCPVRCTSALLLQAFGWRTETGQKRDDLFNFSTFRVIRWPQLTFLAEIRTERYSFRTARREALPSKCVIRGLTEKAHTSTLPEQLISSWTCGHC